MCIYKFERVIFRIAAGRERTRARLDLAVGERRESHFPGAGAASYVRDSARGQRTAAHAVTFFRTGTHTRSL